jgi:phosphate transport system substrate-binding protein
MKRLFLAHLALTAISLWAAVLWAAPAAARDQMWVVSPSAILPFTKAVAERVAKNVGAPAPVVEYADTTLGIKLLCGLAELERDKEEHPHAVGATRRMTKTELEACRSNGVTEIVEVPVGIDLLVLAQSKAAPPMQLTLTQTFLALAKQFPDEYGEMTPNAYMTWSAIDASLPHARITVRTLQRFSETREALQELLLRKGAQGVASIASRWRKARALPKSVLEMREDHPFVLIHETEEVIVRQLLASPGAVGVFGYRFLQANTSLRGIPIDGIEPTPEQAYSGKYPGTRTIYIYLRKADIGTVPGLDRLAAEHLSSAALATDGYLLKLGFVPLPLEAMVRSTALAKTLPPVSRDMLPD